MTKQDFIHLAEVAMSVRPKYPDEGDFDEVIRRFIWAIHASHNTAHFDENHFRDMCLGKVGFTE